MVEPITYEKTGYTDSTKDEDPFFSPLLFSQEVDWIVGVFVITVARNEVFGLPYPWAADHANIIIPYPIPSANTDAPLKPFPYQVRTNHLSP